MRFCLVGAIVYLVDFLVFLSILQLANEAHVVANVLARSAGAMTGFILHRSFTFAATSRGTPHQAAIYAVVFVSNMVLSTALLSFGVDWLTWTPVAVKFGVDAFLILITFLAFRLIVFRKL